MYPKGVCRGGEAWNGMESEMRDEGSDEGTPRHSVHSLRSLPSCRSVAKSVEGWEWCGWEINGLPPIVMPKRAVKDQVLRE